MTRAKAKPAKAARAPAAADDPRFERVVAAFAASADPALVAIADDYAAARATPGPRRFGAGTLRVGGKIFAMVSHGRLVVKLSAARVDALVASGHGTYFDPGHGRLMKQWLSVTSPKLAWRALAGEACAFVAGTPRRSR